MDDDRSFHITTFGCQMNVNDSSWLASVLKKNGFVEAPFEKARIHLLNTCSVREKPEQKIHSLLGAIRQKTHHDPRVLIAVGGCVAQQIGDGFFKKFPQVRLVFGTDGIAAAPAALARLLDEPALRLSLLDFTETYEEREAAVPNPAPPCAFVNIMQGCDNYCAYCIVPYTRGRQKSRSSDAVLHECRCLLAAGARDITLLGQNVNAFGQEAGDMSFPRLLEQVAALPGLERLHFVTPHPKDFSPELVEAFASLPALAPRLHLPLQSGSDRILACMGRKYDMARYADLVARLRATRPDLAFSTDVIVGFPGETDEDFEATLIAMRDIGFAASFSFCYSERPGTAASSFAGKVPPEVKAARLERLQKEQQQRTEAFLQSRTGAFTQVLVEGESRVAAAAGISWQGRDPYGFVVNIPLPAALGNMAGAFLPTRITAAKKNSLMGEAEGAAW